MEVLWLLAATELRRGSFFYDRAVEVYVVNYASKKAANVHVTHPI